MIHHRRHQYLIGGFILSFLLTDAHSLLLPMDTTTRRGLASFPFFSSASTTSASSLGDIMSEIIPSKANSLQETYHYFKNPLDRMILTANGNVQRLVSSYYDTPVTLRILYCTLRDESSNETTTATDNNPIVWDRHVELSLYDGRHVFCRATSEIRVHDPTYRLTEIGIAQFFRHYNILPHFSLHAAGALEGGDGFWRRYTLSCPQLTCHIREEFPAGLWNITEPPSE
jgi:hypothetical protein